MQGILPYVIGVVCLSVVNILPTNSMDVSNFIDNFEMYVNKTCVSRFWVPNKPDVYSLQYHNFRMLPIESYVIGIAYQNLSRQCFQSMKYYQFCYTSFVFVYDTNVQIYSDQLRDYHVFVSTNLKLLLNGIMNKAVVSPNTLYKLGVIITPQGKISDFVVENEVASNKNQYRIVKSIFHLIFPKRYNNLNGRNFNVAFFDLPPYIKKCDKPKSDCSSKYEGSSFQLFIEIGFRTNSTFKFRARLKRKGFGSYINGNWTGLVGQIVGEKKKGGFDFASTLPLMHDALQVITFSSVTHINSLTFCIRSPTLKLEWNALILPLPMNVWLSALTVSYLVCALLKFSTFVDMDDLKNPYLVETLFTILLDQNILLPKRRVTQLVIFLWMVTCYFIGTGYKSNVTASLSKLSESFVPSSFQELDEAGTTHDIILHTPENQINLDLILQNNSFHVFQNLSKRWRFTDNLEECLAKTLDGRHACIFWRTAMQNTLAKHKIKLPELVTVRFAGSKHDAQFFVSVGMRKNSIYENIVSYYIGLFRASHLIETWKNKFNSDYAHRLKMQARRSKNLQFQPKLLSHICDIDNDSWCPLPAFDLRIVFIVYIFGHVVSCLVNALEHF